MKMNKKTVDLVSEIVGEATTSVLSNASGKEVQFSNTLQVIPGIHLKPDIASFVQFSGDYGGLMIINFTKEAGMSIYRNTMLNMGLPEDELAIDYTADEVVNSIGEAVNQIIAKSRTSIYERFGLSAVNNQPNAICLREAILLSIDTMKLVKNHCRRLSFKVDNKDPFHIELSMEQTEFVSLKGGTGNKILSVDELMAQRSEIISQAKKKDKEPEVDFDAIMAQVKKG